VIRGRPLEVLASRVPNDEVPVLRGAEIVWLAKVADARIPLCILGADLLGAVDRCVVRDQELEIAKGLFEQTVEGGAQVRLAVIDGQAYRHLRRCEDTRHAVAGNPTEETIRGSRFTMPRTSFSLLIRSVAAGCS